MGPLTGYRFIEMGGIGPTQLCGMLLADMGAEVVRVDRIDAVELGVSVPRQFNLMNRGRRSIAVDLKYPEAPGLILKLCERCHALYEGFRPGVMERLGLGPDACLARNPRLVYGRMTGWGQAGPLAQATGHDPNYIAVAGVLGSIGDADGPPVMPLNLVGDFGGGAMYLVMSLLAALLEVVRSGEGQVIDCAMVDGAASLMTSFYGLAAAGLWRPQRGANLLDGGAPFFGVFRTRDEQYLVVAALEERFYRVLLEKLGLADADLPPRLDQRHWKALRERLEAIFLTRTRDEWCVLLEGTEACVSPVLSIDEAPDHFHNRARELFVEYEGIRQPAPAPRFSRTPAAIQGPPPPPGQHTFELLSACGMEERELRELAGAGVIFQA